MKAAGKAKDPGKKPEKANDQDGSGTSPLPETPEGPAADASTATDAGAGEPSAAGPALDPEIVIEPGTVALVSKGNERLPVTLRDKAHLNELIATHGAGSVEVQS